MRTCACAESTWAWAVRSVCWASSNLARDVQPSFRSLLLPREGEARLGQLRLGRREVGLRRAQRVLLDLGIEPGDDLARRERRRPH